MAYPRLGFDSFKCGDDMDVPQTDEHGYVSDDSDFRQVIWEFEHKQEGTPLFLFNVTIQNHGAYTVEDYPAEVTVEDAPGAYPKAEQYLTLANKTDEAFRQLVEYFEQQTEPTIIVMFGDHQPSVEQEFLDMAYGVSEDGMTMEEYMDKFKVPFVIWANYPLTGEKPGITSLNFLAQYVLRDAGIQTSAFGSYLWNLTKTIPAMTFAGYFDSEGNSLISQDCGIRIQGGWSRADYQKSFRLYARNDYGKSSFDTAFWDSFTDVNGEAITSCKTFVLRNGGNDANYSKFKDMMIQNMVSGRGVETQQGTACVLFIDGEYWGLYTLQSDYSDRYFADRYNVAKSNVVMYKNDELSEGEAEDEKLFNDMYKFITENDMSIEENYRKACAMIDMDNLVEYAATEMYIFNDDWPQNNYACWRTRIIEQGNSYADGRWRFVLFDTESSCSHYNEKDLETNMFSYLRSQSYTKFGGILCSLIDNEEFDLKLTSAMCQLGSVNFTAERFGEYLEYYKNIYYGELDNYFDRFPTWANLAKLREDMIKC